MPTTIAEIILSPVLGAFSGGFVITVTVSFGVVGFSKITVGAAVVVTYDVVTASYVFEKTTSSVFSVAPFSTAYITDFKPPFPSFSMETVTV